MAVALKNRGLRLRTRLIITYSLVALIAIVAAGAVAFPLLQRYENDRNEEQRQRIVLDYSDRLDSLIRYITQRQDRNPFRDYLVINPAALAANRTWPAAPSLDTVRQKFTDLTRERDLGRLLVLTDRDLQVTVDIQNDSKKSLQDQTLSGIRLSPSASAPGVNRPQDANVTTAGGQQLNIVFRTMTGDAVPNLFGLNNRNRPQDYVIAIVIPDLPKTEVWRDLLLIFGLSGLAALGVALVVGLLLARTLARPLVRLTQASQAMARGEYNQQVTPEGGYELTRLSQSFNQMTHAVAESQRIQRQLIANVSHELKTPLTSIQGFSQAMQDGAIRKPEDYARAGTIISQESARMIRLVNSLLDLSKLESGQAGLQLRELNLAEALNTVLDSFAPRAGAAQINLLSNIQPALPVYGDPDRLRQVFNNLVDNALKYTPAGGTIRLSAARLGSQVIIQVSDTGAGIAEADLPHIFERFYQADKSRRRDHTQEGIGLGLAITREIVQAHSGRIEAASLPGQGTTFTVTLPLFVKNLTNGANLLSSQETGKLVLSNKK